MLIDYEKIQKFLTDRCDRYEHSAPTVHSYCDDLYERVSSAENVQLEEIRLIAKLRENGIWQNPNQAANTILHLMNKLGISTAGHLGF